MKSPGDGTFLGPPLAPSFRRLRSIFPRVPLAVPYWTSETYQAIVRALSRGRVVHGPDLYELKSLLAETLGVADVALCSSGSLALEIALRACGVGTGDEVVVPTFCCTAVIPPILAVGAFPVLADAGDNLNVSVAAIEAVLSERTKAVIVPHLFGNPADIGPILDLLRGRKIRVIDDAAQALGATIEGQAVGSFGDVGVLSFGSEKVCFGLGGGAVVSRVKEISERVSKIHLPPPGMANPLQSLFTTIVWRRWRRWTLPLHTALSCGKSRGPDSPPDEYNKTAMANLNAAVALTLVRSLRANVAARRERARAYQELLGTEPRLRLIPHEPGSACLTQVIRVLAARRGPDLSAALIDALAKEGYEVQGSYVPIHLFSTCESYVRGPLPNTGRIWSDLIELPCEPDVNLEDVKRITATIKQALRRMPPKVNHG
ncbi:MAG: DegT/DnrJ/EryC1/StrS family aminotransferase [Alphaproteobacteria bacterium]